MSNVKHSQKLLRETIVSETIQDKKLHYSLGQKEGNTLSFLKNQRLIIFDEEDAVIYYTNSPQSTPFKKIQNIPKPKTDKANVNLSIIKQLPETSTLSIQYNKKNNKKQDVGGEWNFTLSAGGLAAAWIKLIQNFKNQKLAKALGLSANNSKLGVINDTLAFGMMPSKKEEVGSQTSEVPDKNQEGTNFFLLGNMKKTQQSKIYINDQDNLKKTNVKEVQKQKIKESNIEQSNLKKSNVQQSNIKQSNIKQTNPYQKKNNLLNPYSNVQESKVQETKEKQIKKQSLQKSTKKETEKITNQKYKKNESKITQEDFIYIGHAQIIKSKVSHEEQSPSKIKSSRLQKVIPPHDERKLSSDWNYRFLKARQNIINQGQKREGKDKSESEWQVIHEFTTFGTKILEKQLQKIRSEKHSKIQERESFLTRIVKDGLLILISQSYTEQGKKLKQEFNNYRYLLERQQTSIFLGVPLTIYIQYFGYIALVKAKYPQQAQIVQYSNVITQIVQDLQIITNVPNNSLNSYIYGSNHRTPRLYVDDLQAYLPSQPFCNTILKPQFVRKQERNQEGRQLKKNVQKHINQFNKAICEQPIIPINYLQFKEYMHKHGLNTNYMVKLYEIKAQQGEIKNKYVKRIIHTFLVSKLIKREILLILINLKQKQNRAQEIVQALIRSYMEGGNYELWKDTALQFKRTYGIPMNSHEILPYFLLSSIMNMVQADFDVSKINKEKKLLEQKNIIEGAFIRKLLMKVKDFNSTSNFKHMMKLNLKMNGLEDKNMKKQKINFKVLREKQKLKIFSKMSKFISPFSKEDKEITDQIYQYVNFQPPTKQTQTITMNFLDWLLEQNKTEEYKKCIQNNLQIIDYWVGDDHPQLCPLYESLANYYEIKNQQENSINFSKQSLTAYIRSSGTHTHELRKKYQILGDRQLRAGFKSEAMESYLKCKSNMEGFTKLPDQYPIILTKIGGLHLNFGQVQECISKCLQGLRSAEDHPVSDLQLIRTYQLLSRAYEINGDLQELMDISHLCCKVFNKTKDKFIFDQMIRIGVTGSLCNLKSRKRQKLLHLLKKNRSQRLPHQALEQLMVLSNQYIVMEKFMKFLHMIQKIESEISLGRQSRSKKHQFEHLLDLVAGVVGLQFIQGIMMQNQMQ